MKINRFYNRIDENAPNFYSINAFTGIGKYFILTVTTYSDVEYFLFKNEESVKNFILNEVNDFLVKDAKKHKDINLKNAKNLVPFEKSYIFYNFNDAFDWVVGNQTYIDEIGQYNYEEVTLYDDEKISDKYEKVINLYRNSEKYNL